MTQRKKRTPSGVKKEVENVVSSKIEITNPTQQLSSLHAYRKSIKDMTKDVKKYAISLSPENLLSVKMSLMGAVREVEEMIRERRKE